MEDALNAIAESLSILNPPPAWEVVLDVTRRDGEGTRLQILWNEDQAILLFITQNGESRYGGDRRAVFIEKFPEDRRVYRMSSKFLAYREAAKTYEEWAEAGNASD